MEWLKCLHVADQGWQNHCPGANKCRPRLFYLLLQLFCNIVVIKLYTEICKTNTDKVQKGHDCYHRVTTQCTSTICFYLKREQ